MSSYLPKGKPKLKMKRHYGYAVLLFILGTLLPPLAVAARFGIGHDFWINLLLTICGYIPGHGHNFYIQNIRNNKTHARTPKWAQRYGLVDTTKIQRNAKRSQWATRYNERLPQSVLDTQDVEEGQTANGSSNGLAARDGPQRRSGAGGELWRPEDESYYGQNGDSGSTKSGESSGRWRYPANFDDAVPTRESSSSGKKKSKKDRWARTEDAYSLPEDDGRKKKKKKKKSRSTAGDADSFDRRSDSVNEFPEDPEGGLYRPRTPPSAQPPVPVHSGRDELEHQF